MPDLGEGSIVGGYRIEGVLGQGGMGVVYKATQLALARTVAVKVITPNLASDPGFRERFEREARLAASIDHRNVVPVHEAGEADGLLYLAMRYVEGRDLRSLLSAGRLEPERAANLVQQVAAALDAAHRRGLVHRDVKPANILVTGEGEDEHAYLTDFGLTKMAADAGLTRTGEWVGTVDYAAPEQISGSAVDARTDVYALGCVLYQALTGAVPYVRDSDVAKIYAHLHDPPPRLGDDIPCAADLDVVVQRAMAKSPDLRFPSAGDLGRAAVLAAGGHVSVRPEKNVGIGAAAPTSAHITPPPQPIPTPDPSPTPDTTPIPDPSPTPDTTPIPDPSPTPDTTPIPDPLPTPTPTPMPIPTPEPAPVPPPRRETAGSQPSRRGLLWAGLLAALALLAAGAVVVLGSGGGDEDGGGGEGSGGEQVIADQQATPTPKPAKPRTPKVTDTIEAGDTPDGVAVGDGDVWVLTNGDGNLRRIDPETRKVTMSVAAGVRPDSVVADGDDVFVTDQSGGGKLLRFATRPDLELAGTTIVGPKPEAMAFAGDAMWVVVSDMGGVRKADRASGAPIGGVVSTGVAPIGVACESGRVWVANSGSGTASLRRPDGRVVTTAVGRNPRDVVEAFGFAWVVLTDDDAVVRLDPATGDRVGPPIKVGDGPHKIAAGAGALWVTNSKSGTVSQLDPFTAKEVRTVKVGVQPLGIAVGEGAVWVGNYGSGTVSRIDPGDPLEQG